MSNTRPVADFPRNEPGLVDRYIGDAYYIVKKLYENLYKIEEVYKAIEDSKIYIDSYSKKIMDDYFNDLKEEINKLNKENKEEIEEINRKTLKEFNKFNENIEESLSKFNEELNFNLETINDEFNKKYEDLYINTEIDYINLITDFNEVIDNKLNIIELSLHRIEISENTTKEYSKKSEESSLRSELSAVRAESILAGQSFDNSTLYNSKSSGENSTEEGQYFKVLNSDTKRVNLYLKLEQGSELVVEDITNIQKLEDLKNNYEITNEVLAVNKNLFVYLPYRNGVDNGRLRDFEDFVIDVKIHNVDPSKIYKISYFLNGATLGNTTGDSFRVEVYNNLEEFKLGVKPEYSLITPHQLVDPLDRGSTYETRVVNSETILGAYVVFTLNPSMLKSRREGLPYHLGREDSLGYNTYLSEKVIVSPLETDSDGEAVPRDEVAPYTHNEELIFPMLYANKKFPKYGKNTSHDNRLKNILSCFLDFKVYAPKNKLDYFAYKLTYLYGESTASASNIRNGFRFSRYDLNQFINSEIGDGIEKEDVCIPSKDFFDIDYDKKGIQTLFIQCTQDKEVYLKVTIDVDIYLTINHTFTNMYDNPNGVGLQGMIIDPINYIISNGSIEDEESKDMTVQGVMTLGASLVSYPANNWLEIATEKLNMINHNLAVGGKNPNYFADLIWRETLYNDKKFEESDVLCIQFASSKDLDSLIGLEDDYHKYTEGFDIGNPDNQFNSLSGAKCVDYIIKKWRDDCFKCKDNPSSKWFGTKHGKPVRIMFISHWHDAREYYNEPIKVLAKRWGANLCNLYEYIGFSKNSPMSDGSQVSIMYAMDTQVIDGVTYGWHPDRKESGKYIQKLMSEIFVREFSKSYL